MSIAIIPDSAPFSPEQRAWLNGFLAGWLGVQGEEASGANGAATAFRAASALGGQANGQGAVAAPPQQQALEDESFPWHDPALPIDERLQLAEGKPLERRLMAAMAQLDCGACGYDCKNYSEAIARGEESSLTLCSPGGAETSKALKRLLKEESASSSHGSAPTAASNGKAAANGSASNSATATATAAPNAEPGTRANPVRARVLRGQNLNGPGSAKQTHHVEIDLDGLGVSYEVGDALGVLPRNCPELVEEVIETLGASGDEPVELGGAPAKPLREVLVGDRCLAEITEPLLRRLAEAASSSAEAEELAALAEDEEPVQDFDLLDLLRTFPSARPAPGVFAQGLSRLRPRLYSIASSPRRHPGQVHLTVGRVSYHMNGRLRKGVASTMLSDRIAPGDELNIYVQPSHGFRLPEDPNTPMVMVGPGTGIAPFRAFLEDRAERGATGKNWLFFGDQRERCDFLYRKEFEQFLNDGILTRLDTAFSRDQAEKVYVQHRMLERGAELHRWLEEGASFYVCGDAKRMAVDVDRALKQIVRDHGGRSQQEADAYVKRLAAAGRYLRDVY